jgi:hypothetical protein
MAIIEFKLLPAIRVLKNQKLSLKEFFCYAKISNNNKVYFKWHKNDLLIIDNYLTTHGKQPHAGKREISASLGKLMKRQDL